MLGFNAQAPLNRGMFADLVKHANSNMTEFRFSLTQALRYFADIVCETVEQVRNACSFVTATVVINRPVPQISMLRSMRF